MRHIFTPTRDFGLADPVNAQLVLRLMDRLDEDSSFCPVVTVNADGDVLAPNEGRHLLTAAYWLGWKLYPATLVDEVAEPAREETTAPSR